MKNVHSGICKMKKAAELEHIEYLITGGANVAEILEMFPRYSKEKIEQVVERVAKFCWLNDDDLKGDCEL